MVKTSLIYVLNAFSPKEMRDFGEFIRSPYFNKNQSVIKLFDYIKKFYPGFESEKLEKETVFHKVFGKIEYNDGFMRTVIFNLASLAEKFLMQQNLASKPALGKLMAAEELNNRKLDRLLQKSFSEAEKEIEKMNDADNRNYYYYKFLYVTLQSSYKYWSRYKNKNLADFESDKLSEENFLLGVYFIERALVNYSVVLARRENETVEFDSRLIDTIIKFLLENENEIINIPRLKVRLYEVVLLKEKSHKYYGLLKDMLVNEPSISQNERYSLSNILQAFCTYKTFAGERGYTAERYELYKLSLEKGYYRQTDDVCMDPLLFPNIALTAVKMKEYDWAEEFIKNYSGELSEENRDIIVAYSTGRLYLATGEYEKALQAVSSVKQILHVPYKIIMRNLMLMIYYELSYYEQAEYFMASFKKFITGIAKDYAPVRYERQQNFMKYYMRLLKLKEKPDIDQLAGVITEMLKNPNILEVDWLQQKANELETAASDKT